MLTGDKYETAMEIGLRCGLYDRKSMKVWHIGQDQNQTDNSLLQKLQTTEREIQGANV